MNFFSVVNPPNTSFDKCGGPIKVNRASYRSARDQIESMIMAGQNLVQKREEAYNTLKEIENPEFFNEFTSAEADILRVNPLLITAVRRRKEALAESMARAQEKEVSKTSSIVRKMNDVETIPEE